MSSFYIVSVYVLDSYLTTEKYVRPRCPTDTLNSYVPEPTPRQDLG